MKKIIHIVALVSLLGALIYGWTARENESIRFISEYFDKLQVKKISSDPEGYGVYGREHLKYYLYPEKSIGWGGPMKVAPVVDIDGKIQEIMVLEHRETPAFFQFIFSSGFFDQFTGKGILDPLELGSDIDGVTGATVSSIAFVEAVRKAMNQTAREQMGTIIPRKKSVWSMGRNEIILLSLYLTTAFCILLKLKKARLLLLVLNFLFLGLVMKMPISISNLAALFMGHVPDIKGNLFWWLLIPGTLVLILLLGKNLYCQWVCPFGALQELISRTGGMKVLVPSYIQKQLKAVAKCITWLSLVIALTSSNAANASLEPFAALFSLRGTEIQWYLLSMAIAGSFFIPRFWCRFFCPVGVCFNIFSKTKKCFKKKNIIHPHMKEADHETI